MLKATLCNNFEQVGVLGDTHTSEQCNPPLDKRALKQTCPLHGVSSGDVAVSQQHVYVYGP